MPTVMESAIHLAVGPLLPCPFCGGEAAVEADPWGGESVRITCARAACGVTPKTEYLLVRFAGELGAAWNARHAPERVRGACNPFAWR
jgi:hypothetical protein